MAMEIYDNKRKHLRKPALTVDKFGRIYLNKSTRLMLGINGVKAELYLAYDKVNGRIGLGKPGVIKPVDADPATFDAQRSYASVRNFIKDYGIPNDKAYRYIYVGKRNDIYEFEREDYEAPDAKYQKDKIEKRKKG